VPYCFIVLDGGNSFKNLKGPHPLNRKKTFQLLKPTSAAYSTYGAPAANNREIKQLIADIGLPLLHQL
jgi:hypothetical protein